MNIPVITLGVSAECVTGLEQCRGPVTVARRCETMNELVAACHTGLARAAIVGEYFGELTASVLERLQGAGVTVVALGADDQQGARLGALGITCIAAGTGPAELAGEVADAVDIRRAREQYPDSSYADPARNERIESGFDGQPGRTAAQESAAGDAGVPGVCVPIAVTAGDAAANPVREGELVAVWGPTGAPGRTTVAVNLAAEFAAAGRSVLLIDADTYGASVAASLGLLDESAGIAQACRLADHGLLDSAGLDRMAVRVAIKGAHLSVLTGITRPDRWPELRGAALSRVLQEARSAADVTVVDCGFSLEADEEISFDTVAPRRNAATLGVLELADTVYAVGAADAVGIPRLVRSLAELAQAVPSAAPRVLLNKVRARAAGRSPERALREAWQRFGPGQPITAFLPVDAEAADAALLGGTALLESAPTSPLRTAIAALAAPPALARSEQVRRQPVRASPAKVKFSLNGARLMVKGLQRSGL
jgi:MinD-like ATPase involved in chromosome partitioning or flagellar assembly